MRLRPGRIIGAALILVVAIVGAVVLGLRASLPQIDGEFAVAGIDAGVRIARDADGIPAISAANRGDLAFATGFAHAQDRFFQPKPTEELYDLAKDPEQLNNVAGDRAYDDVKKRLSDQLTAGLKATGDPRVVGGAEKFDEYPYLGGAPKYPGWKPKDSKRL